MDIGLSGRVAVVAGSTSGLGLATARALSEEGAQVAVIGRRAELVAEVSSELAGAVGIVADLTIADDRSRILATVRAELGDVDIVVVNGGGPSKSDAAALTGASALAAAELLLEPAVELIHAVLPGMRERGWGRVLAIGSSAVQQPLPGLVGSNIGRSALAAYLKTLAGEVARDGVTVNMVLPGRIATARTEALDDATAASTGRSRAEVRSASESTIPAGRYGTAEEFASVVAFLAGARASYVTGEQVRVDGGMVRSY